MKLPLDAEMFVPHRKPMRLIDRLNAYDGKSGSASANFAADCPFVIDRKGTIERLALLELIAQTYAASKGYEDLANGADVSQGYLVGISNAVYYSDAYAKQDMLIKVESEEAFDKFHLAAGEVWRNDTLLMKAKLKIWISSEETQQT